MYRDVYELQHLQAIHDCNYHVDIVQLPARHRLSHYTLHFAKYAGRVLEKPWDAELLAATLVDTFIVSLAGANALGLDLSTLVGGAGRDAAARAPSAFGRELAIAAGRMAKACESMDHLEPFAYRQAFEDGIASVAQLCLSSSAEGGIDLVARVKGRWSAIESKADKGVSSRVEVGQ